MDTSAPYLTPPSVVSMQDYVDKITDRLASEMRSNFEWIQNEIEKRWEIDQKNKDDRYKLEQEQLDRRFEVQHEQLELIVKGLDKGREIALSTANTLNDKLATRVTRLEDASSTSKGRQAAYATFIAIGIGLLGLIGYLLTHVQFH
jgi:hypothetical protein